MHYKKNKGGISSITEPDKANFENQFIYFKESNKYNIVQKLYGEVGIQIELWSPCKLARSQVHGTNNCWREPSLLSVLRN